MEAEKEYHLSGDLRLLIGDGKDLIWLSKKWLKFGKRTMEG